VPTLTAPAKLTLSLRIVGVRADGYHLIDAEMVAVDLADTLEIDEEGDGLVVVDEAGDPVPGVGAAGENLVTRALALSGRRAHVNVCKRIPPGAGLGGGSADAAAVLRWAGWSDPLRAAEIGADVPFCVVGGRARVEGIGEIITPLDHQLRLFTVLTPPIECSSAAVYRAWDDLGGPVGDHGNDLEPAALVVEPDLARWRDELAERTGSTPRLAGSGSSWFVEGAHPGEGLTVVETVPAH
jgi:4-diphosphocytidyl-2-C-methyl-D-erythritol kinase